MEELIPTLQEEGEERIDVLEENTILAGVQTINGKAGDLNLKTINNQDLLTTGNLSLATTEQLDTKQDQLTETQLTAVNSGIDSTKVGQIATNADNITTLQNTKQDNLTQTQLNAVNSGIDETKVAQIGTNTENITSNTNRITTIEDKIPSAATSTNQLTDKNYVDNSIATNTANYISDNGQPFQSLADLEAYSGPLTNNDYAFVVSTDAAGNLLYTRYKYNADQQLWAEEYTIANPTFTSTQWAAIDSGVTANDVTQIGTNKSDIASLQSGKQDALSQTQLDAVNSGIDATKVQQIADNTTAIATKQDKLVAGTNIQIAADGKTISATDTTYTAGTGLTLTGTQFSVTEPVPTGFFSDTNATQEGEGTAINFSDTLVGPIDDVKLKGDSFQQTYNGYNLFDSSVTPNNDSLTPAGVTITRNPDGSFSTSGTSNANYKNVRFRLYLEAGTYYFSGCPSGGSSSGYSACLIPRDSTTGDPIFDFGNGNTFTLEEASYIYFFVIRVGGSASTTSFNGLTFKPMISKVQNAPYEPYVGGIPAPNPDFPQDVDVVTGNQTVLVTGKNLFDKNNTNKLNAYFSNATTTVTANDSNRMFYIACEPNTTYTIQKISGAMFNIAYTYELPAVGVQAYGIIVQSTATKATITTDSKAKYLICSYYQTAQDTTPLSTMEASIQVELGNKATTYQAYQWVSYPINLGKNLFDKTDSSLVFDGYIQAGTIALIAQAGNETIFIPCQPNTTYTVQKRFSTSGKNRFRIASFATPPTNGAVGTNLGGYSQSDADTYNTATYTTSADAKYLAVFCYNEDNNVTFAQMLDSIQIELGSTATTYAAYFTPIELVKIGSHQDYIWNDGGTWKKHKEIDKILFDGDASENWYLSAGPPARFRYENVPNIALQSYEASTAPVAYTKYFKGDNWYNLYQNGVTNIICSHDSVHRIAISAPQFTSVALFKTWLNSHNMTVYYAMDTATDETITNPDLIADLNALLASKTYSPQTNYSNSAASPNLPAILTIDVFKNNYTGLIARLNKAGA